MTYMNGNYLIYRLFLKSPHPTSLEVGREGKKGKGRMEWDGEGRDEMG